jgi:SWIM zinc finger
MSSLTAPAAPVKPNRSPLPPVQATGRGVGLADLFNDCAILEIDANGEETPYWCGAITDGGKIVGVRLQKFTTGEKYQVTFDGERWECDCPDCTYRQRQCKHIAALHDALTCPK